MVQQELKEALQMGEMLEKTGNNVWIGALTSEGAAYGPDWKTLVLQVCYVLSSLPPSLLPSVTPSFAAFCLDKEQNTYIYLLLPSFPPSLPPSLA